MRNWNLEDDIRIWSRAGYRDIPDADLDAFERGIARERMLRQQQQTEQQRSPSVRHRWPGDYQTLDEQSHIYPSRIFAGPWSAPSENPLWLP
jgi:hypothetical protein